jgi:prophage DNA circulation protein
MSGATDFAAAAKALAEALRAATTDPADSVRVLQSLAAFYPSDPTSVSTGGAARDTMQDACGKLFRRAALVSLCRAARNYQPWSADDALTLRDTVCELLDAEILISGDDGADETFNALRALRSAVVRDLTQRGANLAQLEAVSSPNVVPAPVIAQRLYRNSSRSDELVVQADPPHPAFMPVSFQALSR